MRNLTTAELAGIAKRAELWFVFGDRDALRVEDVADLITEVRELHQLRDHLIALNRQARADLDRTGQAGDAAAVPAGDLLELDPP